MYAIVDIAGQQYKVEKDQQLYVHRQAAKEGDKVQFDDVLLVDNNGKVAVGAPVVDGAAVKAKIIEHMKGDKVIVFKKKRRKGYKVRNGHRQYLTKIEIEEIVEKGAKRATPMMEAPAPIASKPARPKGAPVVAVVAPPAPKAKKSAPAAKEAPAAAVAPEEVAEAVVEAPEEVKTAPVEKAPEAPAAKADDNTDAASDEAADDTEKTAE